MFSLSHKRGDDPVLRGRRVERERRGEPRLKLERYQEAKALLRPYQSVARRILGDSNEITLTMRQTYARALFTDLNGTFADIREAVVTLEDAHRTARRVFGGAHPTVVQMEQNLRLMREAIRARATAVAGAR